MSISSVAQLAEALSQARVLEPTQLDVVARELRPRFAEPKALARELLQREWLTPFQVNQLFQGKGRELVLGPYILLERIGEGRSGTVYKARHQHMRRLAAVKVVREELLADPAAVEQFYDEIKSIGRLSHPNIVYAYDAGPIGTAHFFAMEYVEGVDLRQLVAKCGPIPWIQTCHLIRQTALGLQYAYEQGRIHYDLQPLNLTVTRRADSTDPIPEPTCDEENSLSGLYRNGVVKIRNLGITLHDPNDPSASSSQRLACNTIGSPDYRAPEWSHGITHDVRASIYSLGCTFYFLLTGKVPFPEGSASEKARRHQTEEPMALELLCDAPAEVVAVVRRMMAKLPDDRYQAPYEVADALANILGITTTATLDPSGSHEITLSEAHRQTQLAASRETRQLAQPDPQHFLRRFVQLLQSHWPIALAGLAALFVVVFMVRWLLLPAENARHSKPPAGDRLPSQVPKEHPRPTVWLDHLQEIQILHVLERKFGKNGNFPYYGTKPITVNGTEYHHALSTHPEPRSEARVSYRLERRYYKIQGGVALNDTADPDCATPLTFSLVGDRKVLWTSQPIQRPRVVEQFDVVITGVDLLDLVVSCPGEAHRAHAVWIDPVLVK